MTVGGGGLGIFQVTLSSQLAAAVPWLTGWLAWEGSKSCLAPFVYPPPSPVYGASFPIHFQTLQTDAGQPLWGGDTRRGTARAMQ